MGCKALIQMKAHALVWCSTCEGGNQPIITGLYMGGHWAMLLDMYFLEGAPRPFACHHEYMLPWTSRLALYLQCSPNSDTISRPFLGPEGLQIISTWNILQLCLKKSNRPYLKRGPRLDALVPPSSPMLKKTWAPTPIISDGKNNTTLIHLTTRHACYWLDFVVFDCDAISFFIR